jgi:glucan 1,3-beta-glucosidase
VWTDLSQIKKMTDRVRLLSIIDCNQTELVLDVASELNMNVWIGLWVDEDESVFLDEISALENIISRGLLDTSVVLGITVGSEALHRGDVSLSELLDHMKQVRILLSTNGGGNLPVSIVDTSAQYRRYQDLREQADIYYMNIHPYFNWKDNNNINGAVDTLIGGASSILKKSSGGASKSLILGEVGWPSGGVRPGQEGRASPAHQLQYFVDFYCKVHIATDWSYYWFTGIDNDWRQASGSANNDIEGNWGFFRDDLELKDHFKDFVFDCNGDEQYSFTLTDWSPPVPPESCRAHTQCEGIGGNCCPSDDGIWYVKAIFRILANTRG